MTNEGMNILTSRSRKQYLLIHMAKKLKCSYTVNKTKNHTHLKYINPFGI